MSRPPPLLRGLLARILPTGPVRDGLLGDLDELYAERARAGGVAAALWYARQIVSAAFHYRIRRPGAAPGEGTGIMETVLKDVRYALRTMGRRPGFALVIVLTLALGIGANTAVFSVVRSILLRPLPYPEDGRLAVVFMRAPDFELEDSPSSPPEYVVYRDNTRSWEQLAAYTPRPATVTEQGGEPERIQIVRASANLFTALRVEPQLGRVFTAEEDAPGADDVAVLSHALWTTRYGADRSVLGRTITLDGVARTIVGVMPERFAFPDADVAAWVPLALTPADLTARGNHSFSLLGRLRPGVMLASAEAELTDVVARMAEPANLHTWHPTYLRPLRAEIVGDIGRTLWVMLGAVSVVLVIACANVANLLLVRAEERGREVSVRTALGAGRARLIGQLLTESLVMAGTGGLAGLAVAYLGVDALRALAPADLPRLAEISVDGTVLAFTTLLTVGAGVLFGLAPALHVGKGDVHRALREDGRTGTAGRQRVRVRQLLVVSETALAVVLLVAAGLLLQSFRRLVSVDPGYATEGVLLATTSLSPQSHPDPESAIRFYEALVPRIAGLPGVSAAGATSLAPLGGALGPNDIEVEGFTPAADDARPVAGLRAVTPGYFAAMEIPVLEGRAFTDADRLDAPPVAVVTEALARTYWPGRSALGQRIRRDVGDLQFAEVVGVVPDVRSAGLDQPLDRGTLYLAHAQQPVTWGGNPRAMTLTVRTALDPSSLAGAVRAEAQALDPTVPLSGVRTIERAIADDTATQRFSMQLQLAFALVALVLSAVGLYGVLAFTVTRRTAEMGIRMALGADRRDVRRMVVRQGMAIVGVAILVGVAGALATGRLLAGLLFEVAPTDPVTYAIVVGVLVAVAFLACWIPARRASAVDPVEALRAG